MAKDPFEEYHRAQEPDKARKALYWGTAIGLQDVDGLKPSDYLLDLAKRNIGGDITLNEVDGLLESYYEKRPANAGDRSEEADRVSSRIAAILSEPAFSFTANEYLGIHRRLFEGIYPHAGLIRDYNITKREWVLDGATVIYGSASELSATLEYDLSLEKKFCYRGLSTEETISHLARFVSNLWQIHVFGEGNTRTTAVFFIKYLRTLGFDVTNRSFEENAWYFRNALVRANYSDLKNGICETTEYVERFLKNLLLGEQNELKSRELHIGAGFDKGTLREPLDYKASGVDIEAGSRSVELMKEYVARTMRPEALGGLGGFSGAFDLKKVREMEDPVLLSGADGCGTKVKLAFIMDKHDTIGIDAVAMCVNDIACAGAEPLFFLDYIACGKNKPERIAEIVKGVAEGCVQAGAALLGGETAEHPGLIPEDEYDLAGFAVGVAERKELITGEGIKPGDLLIGLASSGLHSNGFSLVRRVFEMSREALSVYYDELGSTLGEALLTPTRIYVNAVKNIREAGVCLKGCSHITGGGFYENVPRMLPEGVHAVIRKESYPVPPVFSLLQRTGGIAEDMMYNTFNMGIGMVLAVDPEDADKTTEAARAAGDRAYIIGEIVSGERGVRLI